MSMMFLNPFDHSGLGLYSKTAKSLVERMPVLAKQRKPKSSLRYSTQNDEEYMPTLILENAIKTTNTLLPIRRKTLKSSQPFSKSLSRQQRILGKDGKNKNPSVGAYHPKQILKQPKYVWNVLGLYQKSLNHKKQILDRKQKVMNCLIQSKLKQNKQKQIQNVQGEEVSLSKDQSQLWNNMIEPSQVKFDRFKFRNSTSFVDMNRMLGRQSGSTRQQQSYIQTLEFQQNNSGAFLTSQGKTQSPLKSSGTIEFAKQLSRQKVSSLYKRNSNLVYDCNYSLVCANNKLGPSFQKMVNRNGKSIQTQINEESCPDYSQIWLNRNKKSLPNLQMILKRKFNKQKEQKLKGQEAKDKK